MLKMTDVRKVSNYLTMILADLVSRGGSHLLTYEFLMHHAPELSYLDYTRLAQILKDLNLIEWQVKSLLETPPCGIDKVVTEISLYYDPRVVTKAPLSELSYKTIVSEELKGMKLPQMRAIVEAIAVDKELFIDPRSPASIHKKMPFLLISTDIEITDFVRTLQWEDKIDVRMIKNSTDAVTEMVNRVEHLYPWYKAIFFTNYRVHLSNINKWEKGKCYRAYTPQMLCKKLQKMGYLKLTIN